MNSNTQYPHMIDNTAEAHNNFADSGYTAMFPILWDCKKAFVYTLNLRGTQRQVEYAESLIHGRVAKLFEQVHREIVRSEMTKEHANTQTEWLLSEFEKITSAKDIIEKYK